MTNGLTSSLKVVAVGLLALGGGMLGGALYESSSRMAMAQTATPSIVKATAFELVDGTGNRVATLGTDERRNATLAFFDLRGNKRAQFGLVNGENPRLDINDPQGISVLSLDLGQQAKPRLMLSDPDFNGRVYLGVAEPDAPDPRWKYDTWVLRFTGNRTRPLAIFGMSAGGNGGVTVFDRSGREWGSPFKP